MIQEKSKVPDDPARPGETTDAQRSLPQERGKQARHEPVSDATGAQDGKLQRAALEEAEGEEIERDLGMD